MNVKVALAACLLCGAFSVQAQVEQKPAEGQGQQTTREIPSPEKAARRATDRMNKELQLTEKQYNKIYKLNLKEERKRFENMTATNSMQRPPMGERPEMGGGRPPMGGGGGMRPGMGGGRPPMGGPGRGPQMTPERAEDLQKAAVAKEKKIKKILTEEQYAKWIQMNQPQEPPRRPQGDRPEKGEGKPEGERPEAPRH